MRKRMGCGLVIGLLLSAGRAEAGFGFVGGGSIVGIQPEGPVAIGDVTGDGRNDLIALVDGNVYVYAQAPDATFGDPAVYAYRRNGWEDHGEDLQVGDIDGDGIGDIVIGGSGTLNLAILRSNAASPVAMHLELYPNVSYISTEAKGRRILLADVNDDGRLDVVQAFGYYSGGLRIWSARDPKRQRVFGPFTELAVSGGAYFVQSRDINGDHRRDLVAANPWVPEISIFLGAGNGTFAREQVQETYGATYGFAPIDLAGNGLSDLVLNNGPGAELQFLIQQPTGQFVAGAPLDTAGDSFDLDANDIDGDGDDDLLVAHSQGVGLYLQDNGTLTPEVVSHDAGYQGGSPLAFGDLNTDGCKDVAYAIPRDRLIWQYGTGCTQPAATVPDMAIAIAGSVNSVSIGVANAAGTTSIKQPLVKLVMDVGRGTLQVGAIPANCTIQAQTSQAETIECLLDDLLPNNRATLTFPISLTGVGPHARLTVHASATSETAETTYRNNVAFGLIR